MASTCKALERHRAVGTSSAHRAHPVHILFPPANLELRQSPCSSSCSSARLRCGFSAAPAAQTAARPLACAALNQSVDPLSISDGIYRAGKTFPVHGLADLQKFTTAEPNKKKLTVLMAKSSHCRPCKKFAATYHQLAERFSACHFLEIMGDESQETRKMMVEMKVKVTPTFFLYREGEQVESMTGTTSGVLRKAILARLAPGEPGTVWDEPQVSATDSSDEDD